MDEISSYDPLPDVSRLSKSTAKVLPVAVNLSAVDLMNHRVIEVGNGIIVSKICELELFFLKRKYNLEIPMTKCDF